MNKKEELKNFVKKYNISNDDLVNFYSLTHELKKLGFFDISKSEKFKKELVKIKNKYVLGFLDYGNFITFCQNSPIITTENVETYFLSDEEIKEIEKEKLEDIERKQKKEEENKENQKKEKEKYLVLIKEFDKDNNGIIDVVQVDDFSNILKKNQQEIIEINRDYIKQFVQVSNFLKTKRNSIQRIYEYLVESINTGGTYTSLDIHMKQIDFKNCNKLDFANKIMENTGLSYSEIKTLFDSYERGVPIPHEKGDIKLFTPLNETLIKEYFEILKSDIHVFNILSVYSLNMLKSLIKNDMITFYEIYERFDNLNMFDSKHERDIMSQLQNINNNFGEVMKEIMIMGENIISSIGDLPMISEE